MSVMWGKKVEEVPQEQTVEQISTTESIEKEVKQCNEAYPIFAEIIDRIKALHTNRDPGYKESPIDTLPVESWLHQIRIKAERALQATTTEKMKDELYDTANYCILLLEKLEKV